MNTKLISYKFKTTTKLDKIDTNTLNDHLHKYKGSGNKVFEGML